MKKEMVCTITGAIGGTIAYFFGGWDQALMTLIIFMAIDYISGLIVAGVFHNSKKTGSGTLESRTGWKGLCRKCMTLLFVLVAYRLDLAIGVDYIRDAVIIGFMANELISIVENAGLMGIPLPAVIANVQVGYGSDTSLREICVGFFLSGFTDKCYALAFIGYFQSETHTGDS